MTGRRHRSNCELVGQGVANIASGLFGGFYVTGTIDRTATNVRAGAHGPIAGIQHAPFLLLFVLVDPTLARVIHQIVTAQCRDRVCTSWYHPGAAVPLKKQSTLLTQ